MNKKNYVKVFAACMAATVAATSLGYPTVTWASGDDGWTEAVQTPQGQTQEWDDWCSTWDTIKNSPTQMSLTPGKDETQMNFAWYSKSTDTAAKLKIADNKRMTNAKELNVTASEATNNFAGTNYLSNKTTANGLKAGTYYYSYTVNGKWQSPVQFHVRNTDTFSFLYVGDPQIGSSSGNTATGEADSQGQDKAVRNDSFNWNQTLETAMDENTDLSFIVSAGDQIQTSDKKGTDPQGANNETEYSGYLSPKVLKSLPVATTVGNHDATTSNYSYHFNNPNSSDKGATKAGGDYYYSYGNTVFIVLNTNNTNVAEHQEVIEKALKENSSAKWKVVTLHQDIYGSGKEHSDEASTISLRNNLVPILEKNDIDVVLTGHDHTYSRSFLVNGGKNEKDVTASTGNVTNPEGILYMTANSASGSKYYELAETKQNYIAARWQEDVPTYSVIKVNNSKFSIATYRTDNGQKIDNEFSITKTQAGNLKTLVEESGKLLKNKSQYTASSYSKFLSAYNKAKAAANNKNSSQSTIDSCFKSLTSAKKALVKIGNKSKLKAEISKANKLAKNAKKGYRKGLTALKKEISKSNSTVKSNNVSQKQVDSRLNSLKKAEETLKKNTSRTKLQKEISKTDKLIKKSKKGRRKGLSSLKKTLKTAKSRAKSSKSTRSQLDKALTALKKAENTFKKKNR